MSPLGISLAICLELSARLKLVWIQGPAKVSVRKWVCYFFAGVDVVKRRHELCVIDSAGDVVPNFPVENSHKGLNKLFTAFETKQLTNQNTGFCLEATGHYWIALYCQLQEHGFSIDVINPIQSHALRNIYIRKTKTDQKDSFILTDLLRLGRAGSTQLASETILKLQSLSRLRFEFVRQIGGLKIKGLGILDRIFPEYPEYFSSVFIKTSRELPKEFSSPENLADIDLMELTAFLQEHSRGRLGMERSERIQKLAKGTFGISIAMDAFTLELRLLLQQIEFIEEQMLKSKKLLARSWNRGALQKLLGTDMLLRQYPELVRCLQRLLLGKSAIFTGSKMQILPLTPWKLKMTAPNNSDR
ncbi:MAG: IS110 family transposase, partial [Syntrophomonadaceae bacterium]|nr:IS110 family transposase [Syntrophomonadaceae bacterium]